MVVSSKVELQVMALAGIAQAVSLVHQIAKTGKCDTDALQACLNSIIVTDPKNPQEVFNFLAKASEQVEPSDATPSSVQEHKDLSTDDHSNADNWQKQLEAGYRLLVQQLGNGQHKELQLTRYTIGIISLERKLARRRDLLAMMGERIGQVKRQLHHFKFSDDQVINNLAGIYSDIISPLGPRIQISGKPNLLQQAHVQHKVRALLLAAMRACVLWRQLGGKRRHLIFKRSLIVQVAQDALKNR